jgi:hypothetical protein
MPINSRGAVQAGNSSGGLAAGISGGLMALGKTRSRLAEFEYRENVKQQNFHEKEGAKRETYLQRKAADNASHSLRVNTNEDAIKRVAQRHGKDKPNFNFNATTGNLSWGQPSNYAEKMLDIANTNLEAQQLRTKNKGAKEAAPVGEAPKTARSTTKKKKKKAEVAAAEVAEDAWAAKPPTTPNPTASRTTSNIATPATPAKPTKPKTTKPRTRSAASSSVPATPGSNIAKATKNGKAMS